MTHCALESQRLAVIVERFSGIAQGVIEQPNVVEHYRFFRRLPQGAPRFQRQQVILERLLRLSFSAEKEAADVVQRAGFPVSIAGGAEELQCLLEMLQGLLLLSQPAIDKPDVVDRRGHCRWLPELASQLKSLAVMIQALLRFAKHFVYATNIVQGHCFFATLAQGAP